MDPNHQALPFIKTYRPHILSPTFYFLGSSMLVLMATLFMMHTALNIRFALINKPGDTEIFIKMADDAFYFSVWFGLAVLSWVAMKFAARTAWEWALTNAQRKNSPSNKENDNRNSLNGLKSADHGMNPYVTLHVDGFGTP